MNVLTAGWRGYLDEKKHVISVFIDLSKAFDTVNHSLLLKKLYFYNFSHQTTSLISNYLSNRSSIVKVGESFSKKVSGENFGIPQGSILGPLLFIIFMNDLPFSKLKSKIILYADDITIYFSSLSIDSVISNLTQDISTLKTWLDHNHLILNLTKTNAFLLTHQSFLYNLPSNIHLTIDKFSIPFVRTVKVLGVILDDKLRFSNHITSVCSQVNSKSHLLRRNSYLFPLSFRITLVKLFILSRFNYCSSLFFHEASTVDKTRLNRCYSRSLKKMIGINISTLNVDQQTSVLKEFSLLPLEINYFKCFIVFIHSLFRYPIKSQLFDFFVRSQTRTRSTFIIPTFFTNYGKNSFITIASKLLNIFLYKHIELSKKKLLIYLSKNIITLHLKAKHIWENG